MNTPTALARLGLEIAKMKKSCTPVPDRTFVMGLSLIHI